MNDDSSHKISVAVLGPGAVGGFLAVVLSKHGNEVNCIATELTAARIVKEGLCLESKALGNFTAHPHAESSLTTEPDILIVTAKAPALAAALERVPPELVQKSIIIPFLNGFEHIQMLRDRYGSRVAVGSISIEVMRPESGVIRHLSPHARVSVASDMDISSEKLERVKEVFSQSGIPCEIREREADVIWGKLVRLNAITCVIAASGEALGYVRSDPVWRGVIEGCVKEGAQVARAEGADSDPQKVMREIDALPNTLRTSLARDIEAGNRGELDAIAGAIVRKAAEHGLKTPTISHMIKEILARSTIS